MKNTINVAEILKSEYGITTMKQLDTAIKNLGFIDISLFCSTERRAECKEVVS